jgi:hypothetical protein
MKGAFSPWSSFVLLIRLSGLDPAFGSLNPCVLPHDHSLSSAGGRSGPLAALSIPLRLAFGFTDSADRFLGQATLSIGRLLVETPSLDLPEDSAPHAEALEAQKQPVGSLSVAGLDLNGQTPSFQRRLR